jgi:tetratricopeptide (TPR) repeat protein
MSLLMDALKKAEQDKKAAAKRQLEAENSPEEPVTRNPVTEEISGLSPLEADVSGASTAIEKTGRHSTIAGLELEPFSVPNETQEMPTIDYSAGPEVGTEDQTLNVTMNTLALSEFPREAIEIGDADSPELEPPSIAELQSEDNDQLDETFHGAALDNSELYEETMQGEAYFPDHAPKTYGETLTGIPASQLIKDIGSDDQPTPVAAQTIFAATRTTKSSGGSFKWVLGGLCSLLLVSGIVWYFLAVTPMNRTVISPDVAAGIEKLEQGLDADSMSGNLTGTVSAVDVNVAEQEIIEPGSEDTLIIGEELLAEEESSDVSGLTENSELVEPDTDITTLEPTSASTEGVDQKPEEGVLPETITPEPSLIKISRSKNVEDKGQTIRQAYMAYNNGNYEEANSMYETVLKEFPNNRDALLGLGAIASNKGDTNTAYLHYAQLLSINPRDEFAKVALINLQDKASLLTSESTINTMLHDSPDSHVLHFTLGNIYAMSSRWAQAQQAFFDAYRLNSTNADYAFNLAVSLDHIGQYQSALDYYTAAIQLADASDESFDSSNVIKRIESLTKIVKK